MVATLALGTATYGLAYDSGKGEVFAADTNSKNVSVISDTTNKVVATVAVGGFPRGLAYKTVERAKFS